MVIAEIIGVAIFVGAFILIWAAMMGIIKKCRCCTGTRARLHSTDLTLAQDIKFYKILLLPSSQQSTVAKRDFKYAAMKDPEGRLYLGEL